MVRRYAHLAPEHLTEHALKIDELMSHGDTNMAQPLLSGIVIMHIDKKKKPATSMKCNGFLFGAGYRSRTGDLLITSQLLYQLS